MSSNTERETYGAVRNTPEALRKFRLKLLAIIDEKCPVQYTINGDECTITVQFLEEKKRVKTTAGGRGSRARRRKRREMQKLQMQELDNEMPNDTNENNMPDDTNDFSVVITENGPDVQTRALPVPTWAVLARPTRCQLGAVLARYNDAPGGQHSSPALHQQLLPHIQAEWARTQAHRTVPPDGRNSSPATSFQYPGTEIGVDSIPKIWPKQEKMIAKNEKSNNNGHLLTLLMDQMKTMQSQLNDLKNEQIQMNKTSDKMQCSIKSFREHKEKDIYCWHCQIYTPAVHHCSVKKQWIHLDRFNRLITYSSTEEGANPKDPNDIGDGITMGIPKFQIDNREAIVRDHNKKVAEMKSQQWLEASEQELSQLMEIIFVQKDYLCLKGVLGILGGGWRRRNLVGLWKEASWFCKLTLPCLAESLFRWEIWHLVSKISVYSL
jgi:hypothetical protein